jgi:hypothetical protein
MTQEDTDPRLKPDGGPARYGETLLYDYSKFLTTLSLLALGGVLSLSQAGGMANVDSRNLALVLISIVIGGASGVQVSSGIVNARAGGREPSKWLRWWLYLGIAGLSIGTGSFLTIFWDVLQ